MDENFGIIFNMAENCQSQRDHIITVHLPTQPAQKILSKPLSWPSHWSTKRKMSYSIVMFVVLLKFSPYQSCAT